MEQQKIAIDYSRFDRRKRVVEPEVPAELIEQPVKRRVKIKTKMPYKTLATFAAATALLVTVILSYNSVWNVNSANAALDKEYQQLKKQEQRLLQETSGGMSWREMGEFAKTEFGMTAPSQDQIIYIQMNGEDHAEVNREEGALSQFFGWLAGLFQ